MFCWYCDEKYKEGEYKFGEECVWGYWVEGGVYEEEDEASE